MYGNLINEVVFNGQTKRQAGPHRLGYSTNTDAVNTWVETTHIHAKMIQVLAQRSSWPPTVFINKRQKERKVYTVIVMSKVWFSN